MAKSRKNKVPPAAPMAEIRDVLAQPGLRVETGDLLVVIEAE